VPDTADMLDWRIHLGETAVEAHTAEIMNGQETEPFETQARDALVNILHAMKANMEEDETFDVDGILLSTVVNYKEESGDE
jgi:hypothetical protein